MTTQRAPRLTYANVASTLALLVAVTGTGAAVAVASVPRNSVGSPQIKNNAVASKDIKNDTISTKDLKDGSVTATDLASGPLGVVRAYAWVDNPAITGPVTNPWTYNSAGGQVTSTTSGPGTFHVKFEGLHVEFGNAQVTSYGTDATTCKIQSWATDAVTVRCFDAAGVPTNARFSVAFLE